MTGRRQQVLDLEHYLDVLGHKTGTLAGSRPLEQCRQAGRWLACQDTLWDRLRARHGKQGGTCAMMAMLLGRGFGEERLQAGSATPPIGPRRAFREGVLVEALNPKTAAFFLAFVPEVVNPAQSDIALQFMVLGLVSVGLTTLVDIVAAFAAGDIREGAAARPALIRRIREASGAAMVALGLGLALAKRPAG